MKHTRIKQLREFLGYSIEEFADFLIEPKSKLADIEAGNAELSLQAEEFLITHCKINPDWLYKGKGGIFLDGLDNTTIELTHENKREIIDKIHTDIAEIKNLDFEGQYNYILFKVLPCFIQRFLPAANIIEIKGKKGLEIYHSPGGFAYDFIGRIIVLEADLFTNKNEVNT